MRSTVISLVATFALVALGVACATEKHACDAEARCKTRPPAGGQRHQPTGGAAVSALGAASPTALPEGVNAVQNEMRLLNHAFHQSITAAALGDVSIVPGLFHEVHQARALTDKALADGAWRPAKGDLAGFTAMDQAFHGDLEKLVQAALHNDATAVVDQLDRMLPSCIACHTAHREPGLPAAMKPAPTPAAEHPAHTEHPGHAEHPKH